MKKILAALATAALLTITFASAAGAQDPVIGTVDADPATVPEAGEATFIATGSDFIPDTQLLLVSCTSPADELVPGVSTTEDVVAAGFAISPLENCDIASALQVDTDADGGWTAEVTADIGPNFFLSAGTLDGSQAGAAYIPIVDAETAAAIAAAAAELAVTGVESSTLALVGAALLTLGMFAMVGARRNEI